MGIVLAVHCCSSFLHSSKAGKKNLQWFGCYILEVHSANLASSTFSCSVAGKRSTLSLVVEKYSAFLLTPAWLRDSPKGQSSKGREVGDFLIYCSVKLPKVCWSRLLNWWQPNIVNPKSLTVGMNPGVSSPHPSLKDIVSTDHFALCCMDTLSSRTDE